MFIRNTWYVAAWDYEIPRDGLFSRRILGEVILFYRTTDGTVVALDNRCSHRQAPLSSGRRENDDIRCMYHGLRFDRTGRCIEIPGQSALPRSLKIRSYPVVEKTRWVWIWMGDPQVADPAMIPETTALDHPDWRMKPGYMHYNANYLLISDNLLDFSHLSYVHSGTLGGTQQIAEVKPMLEKLTNGLRLTRRVSNTVVAPYQARYANFRGAVNRYWIYEFLLPGVLLMDSGADDADPNSGSAGLRFKSCQALTPESACATHYFFMQAHAFALDDPTVTESIFDSVVAAFSEDKVMIESQQKLIESSSPKKFVALQFDLPLSYFRELVVARIARESEPLGKPVTAGS